MNGDYLASLIIIGLVIAAAIWSRRDAKAAGQANPIGTARVQEDVSKMSERIGKIETDMKGIRRDLDKQPSSADIAALKSEVAGMRNETKAEVAGMRNEMGLVTKAADRTEEAVVRIEDFLRSGVTVVSRVEPVNTNPRRKR